MATQTRLRPHPDQRFAGHEHVFDLPKAAQQLKAEREVGVHGHRQLTLCKHGKTTLMLYSFDAGSSVPEHVAHGVVVIQVLKGKLEVTTSKAKSELSEGQVLLLDSGVKHDVVAKSESQALVTVSLD